VNANFQVTVSKDYLSFSSAHFITLRGHKCESLHGHNYRVGVTVTGQVDPECQFVLDFALLKDILRPMVDAIDHKVLLPTASPKLTLEESGDRLTVIYLGAPRYQFPRSDCALLPVTNTTAEMLAEYFATSMQAEIAGRGFNHLAELEIEVEESPGQAASYRTVLSAAVELPSNASAARGTSIPSTSPIG
jgi:6-pyruvoyltetrahydropterin/6-carboxytetrahydropterin synthase